eukprot:TRINITY_DN77822_c0_g1_i1.p1 TRINITY_DN77822_c0_g1~~TRINITY_DN77822_c0_g1_i1.p1  ORF type:complete len:193 (+),score=33.41 TRINITY_DN77822_c0_g1_i1:119-697(+)
MPLDTSRLKIAVVGPPEGGKSIISNVLSEATDVASDQYRPTVGVRILEFESEIRTTSQRVTVELWDVGGDSKLQKCWPAIRKDTVGVVCVYNPEKPNHDGELEQWFQWFPRQMAFSASQVMVVQSLRRGDMSRRAPLPAKITQAGVTQFVTVQSDDLPVVRKTFTSFVETLRQGILDKQRQEEEDVMKAQVG